MSGRFGGSLHAGAESSFEKGNGGFSPDGRWIAYYSNETGRNEIYVQRFPGPGGKSQISTTGGTNKVDVGTPVALFPVPAGAPYTVSPDGQRFHVAPVTKEASPITVFLNWKHELKK